jgi:hypothetical protein
MMTNNSSTGDDSGVVDSESLQQADYEQLDEPYPEPEPISYTGSDFDVEGLVRRLDRDDIVIPTFGHGDETVETAGFQRAFVWRKPQMDRFIESILLGYPVPGIFLVQQRDKRYLVLDGQQRLRTLSHFYQGSFRNRAFSLQNVADDLKGLSYQKLGEPQRRTLDNTFIQAIIVKTDGSPSSLESVYQIFERLNSGGTQLTPHEIRVALYAGPLIDNIAALNQDSSWRGLYGSTSPRLRDQELILRILALFITPGNYRRPLKRFLNEFAGANRDLSSLDAEGFAAAFTRACDCVLSGPGPRAFRLTGRQVNAALTEAVMVALLRRLEAGEPPDADSVQAAFDELVQDDSFLGAVTQTTADEDRVRTRLARANVTFAAT